MELRVCSACRKVAASGTSCPVCGAHLRLAAPEYLLGMTFGKYQLERVLGVGGMGAVFVAEHATLRRRAALKIVLPAHNDPAFERRFLREARVLAELNHPNVVEIYDFDVGEWGIPYYVMELLHGETLRAQLSRGGATLLGAAGLLRDVAAGLGAAHRRGVIHRDLKPENIFLARYDDRQVGKLLDFGLAKTSLPGEPESHLTATGMVMGTLHYLAPEQITGGEVGPAADQYALGLVVAELVTGRPVRAGKSMPQIVSTDISTPLDIAGLVPGVPVTISAAVARATDPDPSRRFPDVESFVEAALADAHNLEPAATPTRALVTGGPRSRGARSPRRRVVATAAVATVAVAALALGLLGLAHHGADHHPPTSAPPLLEPLASRPAPLDATRIVALSDTTMTLAVTDGLALEALTGTASTTRVALDPARVLGVDSDGQLLVRDGGDVALRDLVSGETAQWAAGLPATARVWLSPSGRFAVAEEPNGLSVLRLATTAYRPLVRLPLAGPVRAIAVGERLLAVVGADTLAVFTLPAGRRILERPFATVRPTALAVHDEAGLVAVGGWSDHVDIVDAHSGNVVSVPRAAVDAEHLDLLFLPAGPTLAIGDSGGVRLWRPGAGVVATWNAGNPAVADVALLRGRLWALDRRHHRLVELALPGLEVAATIATAAHHPWAAVGEPGTGRVLLGGEDGKLFEVDPERGTVTAHELHSLGITSLVADAGHLASASDDTTIAVWRLPGLAVEWRSRAHAFLVNQLLLDHADHSLWSTSSDGSLKQWSWPDLRELATLDTTALLGRRYSLHALWRSADGTTMLVGTWNHALLVLRRTPTGAWSARAVAVDSPGGYVLAGVRRAAAVVLLGVRPPAGVWVWDLRRRELFELADAAQEATAAVAVDGERVLGFGAGVILDYRFRREDDGALAYRLAIHEHGPLGVAGAACRLGDGRIAVVADDGRVSVLDLAVLTASPLLDERLNRPLGESPAPVTSG